MLENGVQIVQEVKEVKAFPDHENSFRFDRVVYKYTGGEFTISSGQVYVMNENGKTVADYNLLGG